MPLQPGVFPLPPIKIGDTYPDASGFASVATNADSTPYNFPDGTIVLAQLRRASNKALLYQWRSDGDTPNASVIDNAISWDAIAGADTQKFPTLPDTGAITFELQVTLPDGTIQTWLVGSTNTGTDNCYTEPCQ